MNAERARRRAEKQAAAAEAAYETLVAHNALITSMHYKAIGERLAGKKEVQAAAAPDSDALVDLDNAEASAAAVATALAQLNKLCEVEDYDAEDEWDGVAPPCIVRASNGEVIEYAQPHLCSPPQLSSPLFTAPSFSISLPLTLAPPCLSAVTSYRYAQLISAVVAKLDEYADVERVQAVGCSLISRLANCDAAKQQSVDAAALEAVAAALHTHHASKHVAQCAALAVLKLTLPGQQRPDSRDAFRVQRAIDAGCLSAFARVLERYHARPVAASALPPLRVRLCAAANAWLEYVEENYLAPTAARYEGAYAHIRHAPLAPPANPPARPSTADTSWTLALRQARELRQAKAGTAPPLAESSEPSWWDEVVKFLW